MEELVLREQPILARELMRVVLEIDQLIDHLSLAGLSGSEIDAHAARPGPQPRRLAFRH